MPILAAIVKEVDTMGVKKLDKLTVQQLKDLLKYFFGVSSGLSTKKKTDLVAAATTMYNSYNEDAPAPGSNNDEGASAN